MYQYIHIHNINVYIQFQLHNINVCYYKEYYKRI